MTINIKISTDMHTMAFDPDFFSLSEVEKRYLAEYMYRTGDYLLQLVEVDNELST